MDVRDFTTQQNQALLDLVVLTMYLDGNLARVEEARVQQLIGAMGFPTEYDRNRQFDASVTRVRAQSAALETAKNLGARLAGNFTERAQQQRVCDFLSELTALDGSVCAAESEFLTFIRKTFKL